ncbi:unnamed protein product [Discosporangium mesarthrocarpum]
MAAVVVIAVAAVCTSWLPVVYCGRPNMGMMETPFKTRPSFSRGGLRVDGLSQKCESLGHDRLIFGFVLCATAEPPISGREGKGWKDPQQIRRWQRRQRSTEVTRQMLAYTRAKRPKDAIAVFEKHNLPLAEMPTVANLVAMKSFINEGRHEDNLRLLARMKRENATIVPMYYLCALTSCVTGELWREGVDLLEV